MNFLITFSDRHNGRGTLRSFARFLLVATVAVSVSTVLVYLLSMFMHPLAAKLIAAVGSTAIGYVGSYRFVFSGDSGAGSRTLGLSK